MQAISRARLLRTGAAAAAATAGGALLHDGAPAATTHSAALDAKVLAFALGIERMQQAFYTDALAQAARIVSVEARHAAWVRDIAGVLPAPEATEPVVTPAQVQQRIKQLGFIA